MGACDAPPIPTDYPPKSEAIESEGEMSEPSVGLCGTVRGFDGAGRPRGHMSTDITVWCGTCDQFLQTDYSTKADAKWQANQEGWRYSSKFGWLCPECAPRLIK